jgi:hypothetical protein
LGKLVAALLAFAFWLLLGMLGNILFEWCVDVVVWPGEGPAHSTAMVEDELRGLEAEFGEGIFIRRPALFARKIAIRHLYRPSNENRQPFLPFAASRADSGL